MRILSISESTGCPSKTISCPQLPVNIAQALITKHRMTYVNDISLKNYRQPY